MQNASLFDSTVCGKRLIQSPLVQDPALKAVELGLDSTGISALVECLAVEARARYCCVQKNFIEAFIVELFDE